MSCVGLWRGLIARSIRRALLRDAQHPAGIRTRLILGKTLKSRAVAATYGRWSARRTPWPAKNRTPQLVPGEEFGMYGGVT